MSLAIEPVSSFDFDLSAKIFSDDDKQIRKYENGRYWQIVRINNKLVFITIRSAGTVDEPKLLADLKS